MTLRQELIQQAKANERIMREARQSVNLQLRRLEMAKAKGLNFVLFRIPTKRDLVMEYALKIVLQEYGYDLEWMGFKKFHKIIIL